MTSGYALTISTNSSGTYVSLGDGSGSSAKIVRTDILLEGGGVMHVSVVSGWEGKGSSRPIKSHLGSGHLQLTRMPYFPVVSSSSCSCSASKAAASSTSTSSAYRTIMNPFSDMKTATGTVAAFVGVLAVGAMSMAGLV